jgi:hypothetical protein
MGIVSFLLLLASAPGAVSSARAGQLILRIFDAAHIPAPILEHAIQRAQWAFQGAGIATAWLPTCYVVASPDHPSRANCARMPAGSPDPLEICIVDNSGVSSNLNLDVLGSTNLSVGRVYVLWDRIKQSNLAKSVSEDIVLARVILHETGHAAGLKHSPSGIMRPELSPDLLKPDAGPALTFSPGEAREIRRAAVDRISRMSNAQADEQGK